MNWRIGEIWGKILLVTIYELWRNGRFLRLRRKYINHIR
jgi:hypothetical protein